MVGNLAESWEIVDDETIVLHIRKGIRFHNKPPTNGREMDANDVAYSLMRVATSDKSFVGQTSKFGVDVKSITASDKWTVVFKVYPGKLFLAYYSHFIQGGSVIPREVVEKYGDMQDWRNLVGTGPFMLTEYVPGSVAKYVRNPSYWGKDPLHPDNTLPYLDNLNYLIIPDRSTQMAALRTGKLDLLTNLQREDKEQFEKTNPKMLWERFLPLLDDMRWRVDTAPFSDLRVRRALWMAVDRQEMVKSLYKGDAEIQAVATYPIPETMRYYTPLDQLPQSAQELFNYNPDKAKALLTEAGYPKGFKTEIITPTGYVDLWSVIKYYWAAVGVDLDIQVRDGAVLSNIINNRTFTQIVSRGGSEYRPESFTAYATGQNVNSVFPNDPIVDNARLESSATFMRDKAANAKLVKETIVRIIDQAYSFSPPKPYYYIGWQPWLKSYHGEQVVGGRGNTLIYTNYMWIDQEMKKSMVR
jgi:peptide/nickel transport system substrate-binding protein